MKLINCCVELDSGVRVVAEVESNGGIVVRPPGYSVTADEVRAVREWIGMAVVLGASEPGPSRDVDTSMPGFRKRLRAVEDVMKTILGQVCRDYPGARVLGIDVEDGGTSNGATVIGRVRTDWTVRS